MTQKADTNTDSENDITAKEWTDEHGNVWRLVRTQTGYDLRKQTGDSFQNILDWNVPNIIATDIEVTYVPDIDSPKYAAECPVCSERKRHARRDKAKRLAEECAVSHVRTSRTTLETFRGETQDGDDTEAVYRCGCGKTYTESQAVTRKTTDGVTKEFSTARCPYCELPKDHDTAKKQVVTF